MTTKTAMVVGEIISVTGGVIEPIRRIAYFYALQSMVAGGQFDRIGTPLDPANSPPTPLGPSVVQDKCPGQTMTNCESSGLLGMETRAAEQYGGGANHYWT